MKILFEPIASEFRSDCHNIRLFLCVSVTLW